MEAVHAILGTLSSESQSTSTGNLVDTGPACGEIPLPLPSLASGEKEYLDASLRSPVLDDGFVMASVGSASGGSLLPLPSLASREKEHLDASLRSPVLDVGFGEYDSIFDAARDKHGTPYADWFIGDIRSDIASQTECNLADAGCQSVVSGDIFDLTTVKCHTVAHEKEMLSQVELLKDRFGKMAACKEQSLSEALEMISELTSKIEMLESKPCQPKGKARKCR